MRWTAAVLALAWLAPGASAADDLAGAARELGRRTAGAVGNAGATVSWRNISSVPADAVAQARAAFESVVHAGAAAPAAEIQMTISESASGGLLVEELRRGDDRQ